MVTCGGCGKQLDGRDARTKWCNQACKQKNTRQREGKRGAALTAQLAAAQETIRTLTAELEVRSGSLAAAQEMIRILRAELEVHGGGGAATTHQSPGAGSPSS